MHDTANWRLVCLIALGAFAGLSVAAFAAGLLPGDLPVRQEFVQESGSLAYEIARLVDPAGTWIVLLPASLVLFALSAEARRGWWLWTAILAGSSLIEHISKFVVGRPRPSGFALGFPSGHSTAVATFAVVLIYILSRERIGAVSRWALCALALATNRREGER